LIIFTKKGKPLIMQRMQALHTEALLQYLLQLSETTRSRFAPHAASRQGISDFYAYNPTAIGWLALDAHNGEICGYALSHKGILSHESARLSNYPISTNGDVATFAPSVADKWQGEGIGSAMLDYICGEFFEEGFLTLVLWGGVQESNVAAVEFYKKKGFELLGSFDYNGTNYDMMLKLTEINSSQLRQGQTMQNHTSPDQTDQASLSTQ
jgi:ribosomal protein S18 acetylase RimI-like enzyme